MNQEIKKQPEGLNRVDDSIRRNNRTQQSLLLITHEEWLTKAGGSRYRVDSLARICGVSISTLKRHFQAAFRKSPQMWLREVRMVYARRWLAEGMKVGWTARELCYKSEPSFSREFKRFFGYPPSAQALGTHLQDASAKLTDLDIK